MDGSSPGDSRPLIKVQRVVQHRKLTALAVVVTALALTVAVMFSVVAFQRQQNLSTQNARIIANQQVVIHSIAEKIAAEKVKSDTRWCALFGAILNTPRPDPKVPLTPEQVRFVNIFIRLTEGFHCPAQ